MGKDSEPQEVRLEDLRSCAPLSFWPDAALERLAAVSRVAWHEPGEVLARAFEPAREMWIVLEGCIEASKVTAAGGRFLADLMAPPQVAGLVPVIETGA